jgi:ABC-2 type transport system permease protein
MKSIFWKEFIQFISSPIGFISMGIFYILSSLFLWIIEGNYNIIDNKFADLSPFFQLSPWILIFVMSAISMKSFSEEYKTGTIETLLTKPITESQLVLGKFYAIWLIGTIMLIPSIIYIGSVYYLTQEGQTIEWGIIFTGYLGLILLIGAFSAIGTFTSALFNNQISAFLSGMLLMFLFYSGFEAIGNFNLLGNFDYVVQQIGMKIHYDNFIKGLVRFSDFVYFISLIIIFITSTIFIIHQKQK